MDEIDKAYKIAVNCLRACYQEEGIQAGVRLWDDYWLRDTFFACYGALALEDYQIVKKSLLLAIKYQKNNGQLPLRISNYFLPLKLVGIKIKGNLFPWYLDDKIQSYPRDQNSLFIIASMEYIKKTNDLDFARKYFRNFEKALEWNFFKDSDSDHLIEENYYSTWADSIRKKGKVLYTNICHCKAIESLAEICNLLNEKEKYRKYIELYKEVKEKLNYMFWNREHFIDWIGKKRFNFFSSDGNMLAILWDIASKEKARLIFKFVEKHNLENFTIRTNYPRYPFWTVSFSIRFFGMADYHNGQRWLWVGCLDILNRLELGMKKEAEALLRSMSRKIIEYDSVYEVYERSGRPVYRVFYKSEPAFAWSAALFILAVKKFKKN